MSLSSLLVQREIATIRQVEEALARQVLYGGDLATNLLEVATVEEWRVAVTLADSFGLPAAPPGALAVAKAEALGLVPADVAGRLGMVPLSGDAAKLVVATAEPLRKEDVEQLASSLGIHVEARIALEVRVREALLRAYGVPVERRIERLIAKLSKQSQGAPPPPRPSQPAQRSPSVPPFTLSPAYGMTAPRSPLSPQNREETPLQPDAARAEAPAAAPAPPEPEPSPEPPPPAPSPEPPPPAPSPEPPRAAPSPEPPRAAPPPPPPSRPRHITAGGFPGVPASAPATGAAPAPVTVPGPRPHVTGAYQEARATFVKPTGHTVPPPRRRRRGPLTPAAAAEELEEAADRDALLDLFFDFSRQFFDYTALFIAHGEIAEGRDAFGDGAPRERVVGIGVPLDMPSIFATARERRAPVIVRPSIDGVDGVLMSDLRRPTSVHAAVFPLLVRGRPVALLYTDTGDRVDTDSIEQVAKFASAVGQGFERLIVRKKLAGFSGAPPGGTSGKVDAAALTLPSKKPAAPAPGEKATRATALGHALFDHDHDEPYRPPTDPQTPAARRKSLPPSALQPERPHAERARATDAGRTRPLSNRPPPPQLAGLHRPSGPPIPREEPSSEPDLLAAEEVEPEPEPAEIEAGTLDDAASAALLEEISADDQPIAADGEEVLIDVTPPPPESEQAISVGPRRPPVAHSERALPSIIVDIEGELAALVDRVLSGSDDGPAEAELLRQGASAMPAIMARFPGPLDRARSEITEPLPRASECGPLLRLITRQRKVALAYVLEEVGSPDVSRRFWGTFLLAELPYAEGARLLVPRLFDPDAKIRLVARAAARAMAEVAHEALLGEIGRIVRDPSTSRTARLGLLGALGDMREGKAVALLIGHLDEEDNEIATVARRALIAITRQDFALDTRKWLAWWGQNSSRHRIEWLIDALVDETPGIRRAAGEELKALTNETFGYYDDLPKRERERAQQRFRDWWASEGRARFVRS
jgi:hypothetical protein